MPHAYRVAYGDIHNHNAHGYGQGSIERSVEIARTHLDFFAFTGHSSWHDLGELEGGMEAHFLDGFKRLAETWPRVQKVIADSNRDGDFASFLGFEWHSHHFGDHCVVFPDDFQPVCYTDTLTELRRFCVDHNALMLPHHLAYPQGCRGANWDEFEEICTPVVEIYSMHGSSETDHGPYPMLKGSPGGRSTTNTVRHALARGLRFGFVGSSDNHLGFPGAYGEGLMAALVEDLTRQAILDAIWARRTYALTGDRIAVDFTVDGAVMGSTIRTGKAVEVSFSVDGRDEIESVELVRNGEVAARFFPPELKPDELWRAPVQLRLEWGWGPWGPLRPPRTVDWAFDLSVEGGTIEAVHPCLSSGPFDEDRRHRFRAGQDTLSVTSYTSRKDAFHGNPNQSVVLELAAGPDARIGFTLNKPAEHNYTLALADLAASSMERHVGPYPAESYQWHRLVTAGSSSLSATHTLDLDGGSYVYLRVTQKNGHMAWTSPVFVDPA